MARQATHLAETVGSRARAPKAATRFKAMPAKCIVAGGGCEQAAEGLKPAPMLGRR